MLMKIIAVRCVTRKKQTQSAWKIQSSLFVKTDGTVITTVPSRATRAKICLTTVDQSTICMKLCVGTNVLKKHRTANLSLPPSFTLKMGAVCINLLDNIVPHLGRPLCEDTAEQ